MAAKVVQGCERRACGIADHDAEMSLEALDVVGRVHAVDAHLPFTDGTDERCDADPHGEHELPFGKEGRFAVCGDEPEGCGDERAGDGLSKRAARGCPGIAL